MTAKNPLTTRVMVAVVHEATMSAMPKNSTVAAAVCPDGKLEVDGVMFIRGTAGRGRATMKGTGRNTVSSNGLRSNDVRVASGRIRIQHGTSSRFGCGHVVLQGGFFPSPVRATPK